MTSLIREVQHPWRSTLRGCLRLSFASAVVGLLLTGQPLRAANPDLSRPIRFELDIGTFDIPYRYLEGRPPLSVLDQPNRRYCTYPEIDCFYLIFAMPDGGFSEQSATDSLIVLRLADGQIDLSVKPRFFVIAGPILPWSFTNSNRLPEQQLQNIRATGVDLAQAPTTDGSPHQLFARAYRHLHQSIYYSSFLSAGADQHHISYFIQCNDAGTAPNPLCTGTAALHAYSATFQFRFQARYLDQVQSIVTRADELLTSWKR
jgi:hypothetical protein